MTGRWIILGLGVVAIAWPSFWMPFRGDEAFYLMTAKELAAGQVLYRDTWDITNPGIFWFYQLAGTLFGFHEEGLRTLDLLWQLAFAFTLSFTLKRTHGLATWPVIPSLIVTAMYYFAGYSSSSHLARVEGLVVFPLYVTLWGFSHGRTRAWLIAAGMAAGVVILFKVGFTSLVAFGWGLVWLQQWRAGSWRGLDVLWLIVGVLIPLLSAFSYFAYHDALGVAGWTLFVVPRLSLAELEPAGLNRLIVMVRWFTGLFAGPLAFMLVGVAAHWRSQRDPLLVALVGVFLASFPVVLFQRLSWWSYHGMLPAGLLAMLVAYCWPTLIQRAEAMQGRALSWGQMAFAGAVISAAMLPLFAAAGYQALVGVQHGFGLRSSDRANARLSQGDAYRKAQAEADWLCEPARLSGEIFVCGDPLIYHFSSRRPGNRISGWSLEMYPAAIRQLLIEDFARRRPVYVFVSRDGDDYPALLQTRFPEFVALLKTHYRIVRENKVGVWYELSSPN
jgi:hypothetical protein